MPKMTKAQRSARARKAAYARWGKPTLSKEEREVIREDLAALTKDLLKKHPEWNAFQAKRQIREILDVT